MIGKGLHAKVKELAERKQGLSLLELKPNSRELAQRLIKQGALHSIGKGRYQWRGEK